MIDAIAQYLVNALWQVPAIAAVAALAAWLGRRASASSRYWIWVSASLAAVLTPALSLIDLGAEPGLSPQDMLERVAGAPAPVPSAGSEFALPAWMAYGYLGFLAIRLLWLGHGYWRTREMLRSTLPASVPCSVEVRTQPGRGPFTVGWLRPVIVIPDDLLEQANAGELDCALRHELAHVRRGDFAANLLLEFAVTPIALHPAALWMKSRLVAAREEACDEAAAGANRHEYAKALASLAQRIAANGSGAYALGVFDDHGLERRVARLLGGPGWRRSASFAWAVAVLGAITAVATAMSDRSLGAFVPPDSAAGYWSANHGSLSVQLEFARNGTGKFSIQPRTAQLGELIRGGPIPAPPPPPPPPSGQRVARAVVTPRPVSGAFRGRVEGGRLAFEVHGGPMEFRPIGANRGVLFMGSSRIVLTKQLP